MAIHSSDIDLDAREILQVLSMRKNVILSGPPGTGKSRLLNQIRDLFSWNNNSLGSDRFGTIPLPASKGPIPNWFPSADRNGDRRVFSTVFDQNTKYRDFMRGLVPSIGNAGEFQVTKGTLYRASMHALEGSNAALVIIDEINRGPAVAAFGSALVGLEPDKRLGPNARFLPTTQEFEILGDNGTAESFALPNDLYILAAMNEADTSVEPLDVAFLRRFGIYRLEPQPNVLRKYFDLNERHSTIRKIPATHSDVYEVLTSAWEKFNRKILMARGTAYQLGHGALMHRTPPNTLEGALEYAAEAWATLRSHLDEVFFGDTRAMVDILCTAENSSPFFLEEATFAGQSVNRIIGPLHLKSDQIYPFLATVTTS